MSSRSSAINSLPTILSNKGLLWPGYIFLVCLLSAVCFGSLKDHLLDIHDYQTFQDNEAIGEDFTFFFSLEKQQPTGRPVAELVKFLAYLAGGNNPAFFHLLVVAFHASATILLARLAWQLGTGLRLSLTGGLLFLLNVAHFRAVHHISALDYPLALTLGLGALLFYLGYLSSRGWWRLGAFYLAVAAGLMAHMSVVIVIPFCIYCSWSRGLSLRAIFRPLLPLLALAIFQLAFIFSITGRSTRTWDAIGLYWENNLFDLFPTAVQLFFWLLSRLVTTAHWLLIPLYKWQTWELFFGVFFLVILLLLLFRNRFPGSAWSLWTILSLLPFAIVNDPLIRDLPWYFSRYLYAASAGTSMLAAWGIECLCARTKSFGPYLHAAILAAVFAASYFHLKQAEAISFYSSGRHYLAKGDFQTGAEQLRAAIRTGPATIDLHDTYLRLCLVEMSTGNFRPALKDALAIFPDSFGLNIYKLLVHSLDPDSTLSNRALVALNKLTSRPINKEPVGAGAESVNPGTTNTGAVRVHIGSAYNNLGMGFHNRDNLDTAIIAYCRALQFDPERTVTYQRLLRALDGIDLFGESIRSGPEAVETNANRLNELLLETSFFLADSGELEMPISITERVLKNDPGPSQSQAVLLFYRRSLNEDDGSLSSSACLRIGLGFLTAGNANESIKALRKALEKDRDNSRAQFALGLAFLAQGQVEEAERHYEQGISRFGRSGAGSTEAVEDIHSLIARGVQVAAARKILATYFPTQ